MYPYSISFCLENFWGSIRAISLIVYGDKITLVCADPGALNSHSIVMSSSNTMASLPALRLCRRFSLQRPVITSLSHRQLPHTASHQLRMASNSPAPRFAEGEDPQKLGSDTAALQQQGWALDHDGMGVTKTFHFKSYFKAVVSVFVLGPCARCTG